MTAATLNRPAQNLFVTGSESIKIRKRLDEFLALPEDSNIERELINGVLKERPLTRRNRFHAKTEASIATFLTLWLLEQPESHGDVLSGKVGFTLQRDPGASVGIDVVYVSAEVGARQNEFSTMIEGVPVLAVDVLSQSDTHEDVTAKVDQYLAVGVPLVWIADPHFRIVTVHRPDQQPNFFTTDDDLTAEPYLPGFQLAVRRFFE